MRFDNFTLQQIDQDHVVAGPPKEQSGLSIARTPSDEQQKASTDRKSALKNVSEPVDRRNPAPAEHEAVRSASAINIEELEKSTIHHAPIFPGSHKPSKTGLRMPASFPAHAQSAGASVETRKPSLKSPLVQPQLSRPATAGAEQAGSAVRPTGKRRPNVGRPGLEGAFPFSTFEDLQQAPRRPWHAEYSNDEVRESFRSALTNTSSQNDTTSTDRSSIATEGTSITDSTLDAKSRPSSKAGGMVVDDVIDMYVAGFADDNGPEVGESRDTSISEEECRRSKRISEAINDSIGGIVPSPPKTGDSVISNMDRSNHTPEDQSFLPPAILPPTSTRDQYGFLKASHHVSVQQYDTWNATYLPDQERRTKKWQTYMQEQGLPTSVPTRFPRRSTKTERFIRKGIPPAWRGSAWFFYAGGDAYLQRHHGLYKYVVSRSEVKLPEADKEAIERDINRTFPDNVHFKPDSRATTVEPPILVSLRRVLRAFAFHSPRIGYCQSLNFVTGLLLLFLPEEKAFWMLHIITTVHLPGTHEVSLEGANVDLWVLMVALKSTMPNIWTKVGAAGTPADGLDSSARLPPISLCTTSWFMSLFIGTLPLESVLRVWDVLFYEGSRTLFRVALSIFKLGEQRIRSVADSMELFQVVQSLPRSMLDASSLINVVCRRGAVSAEWIEAKRWERREWYSKERARALVSVDEGVRREYFAQRGEPAGQKSDGDGPKRRESLWRRKRKGSAPERKFSARLQQEGSDSLPSSPINDLTGHGQDVLAV